MDKLTSYQKVATTFENPFDKERYLGFIRELLNKIEDKTFVYKGNLVPKAYQDYVSSLERIAKYNDGENAIDVLIVYLKKGSSVERARSMQRNFVSWYLNGSRKGEFKDAALVAFVPPNKEDWRFSLVKMDYTFEEGKNGRVKVKQEFTPARRWSFLVGKNEKSHTAQSKLAPILQDDEHNPTLEDLEEAFNIEKVTREFFEKYRDLFIWTKEELDKAVRKNKKTEKDFKEKGVDTVNFAKKLLGQVIFLYFLQKKGWFGVPRGAKWGEGSKNFLREMFEKKHGEYDNFFNDILEPLFYEALRVDRSHEDHYYSGFKCKIPFLNGGLFDPLNNYDWVNTDILLPNELFSNKRKTKEGDHGDGILDIFDRYNFTVKEDEPLEKEVAIDPELLGKAYEKFNAIRPDNYSEFIKALRSGKRGEESKFNRQYGVYYTPREIVHYMCQESFISYLDASLNEKEEPVIAEKAEQEKLFGRKALTQGALESLSRKVVVPLQDIEVLIRHADKWHENEMFVDAAGKETDRYSHKMPESVRKNASLIDERLSGITVCDPAVGSGAFPVGIMTEIVRTREILRTWTKSLKSTYDLKRDCIENSLYGVDIDAGAVEIAKLRLWLSLVVDEDDPKNIRPLPNLDYKVVCGDSLLGFPENWGSSIEKEIEMLMHKHFSETNPRKKQTLKASIDKKIKSRYENSVKTFGYTITFDFRTVFSEVFQRKNGFDLVIANPPYIGFHGFSELKPHLTKLFKTAVGKFDMYVPFIEKGLQLTRKAGVLTYICPTNFMKRDHGKTLRQLLIRNTKIAQMCDFEDVQIFEDVLNYTGIFIFSNEVPTETHSFLYKKRSIHDPGFSFPQQELGESLWTVRDRSSSQVIKKMSMVKCEGLGVIARAISEGIVTGANSVFLVNKNSVKSLDLMCEFIRPCLRGSEIRRYFVDQPHEYVIYPYRLQSGRTNVIGEKELSTEKSLWKYLTSKKDDLSGRAYFDRSTKKWYELWNQRDLRNLNNHKIVVAELADAARFALVSKDYFYGDTASGITLRTPSLSEYMFLLGILNSRLIEFYFKETTVPKANGFYIWKKMFLENIPIRTIDTAEPTEVALHDNLVALVEQMLNLQGEVSRAADGPSIKRKEREILLVDKKIDAIIYKLYGLTEEEMKIVEGK